MSIFEKSGFSRWPYDKRRERALSATHTGRHEENSRGTTGRCGQGQYLEKEQIFSEWDYLETKNRIIRSRSVEGISNIVVRVPPDSDFFVLPILKSEANFVLHDGQAISIPPMRLGKRSRWPHFGQFFTIYSDMCIVYLLFQEITKLIDRCHSLP